MTPINSSELTLSGIEYIRKDSVTAQNIGDTRIIVADEGWVFVGKCEDNADGSVTLRDAKNIRRWGTTKGLGELSNGPTSETKYDSYGVVRCVPVLQINVIKGW